MTYKFVTRINSALSLPSYERFRQLEDLICRLFDERDAYREVAINKDGGYQPKAEERIDAEVARILEQGEKK